MRLIEALLFVVPHASDDLIGEFRLFARHFSSGLAFADLRAM